MRLFVIYLLPSLSYTSDLQSLSFNAKIESFELNLKKLEDELILEKNMLANNVKERVITVEGDHNSTASDYNPIDTNIIKNQKVMRQDRPNSVRCLKLLTLTHVIIRKRLLRI